MVGILLIIVGVAFGLIAAAVVVNRRIDASDRAEAGEDANPQPEPERGEPPAAEDQMQPAESPRPASDEAAEEEQPGEAAAGFPGDEQQPAESAEATEDRQPTEAAPGSPADEQPADAAAEAPDQQPSAEEAETPTGGLLGELHRDPATGALIFRSGAREFRSAADITDREEHDRLASAAADWLAWFERSPKPAAGAPPAPKPAASQPPASATGIVQAIDQILQRELERSGMTNRGVRLIQDLSGGVKVLIGVKSYEVDDVPDDEVRNLIRQAVAEWEGQQ